MNAPTWLWSLRLIVCVTLFTQSAAVFAVVRNNDVRSVPTKDFYADPYVRKQMRFWEAIFQKYDSSSVVIHDMDEPLAMIDVLNFDRYVQNDGAVRNIAGGEQNELVKRYVQRYEVAIERFGKHKEKAVSFGPIERRLFEVYQREPSSLARLYRGDVRLRTQTGLADRFIEAAKRAQEYLPYMEDVFRRNGLPVQLTRLPFVESMFNLGARSKVGASGIWQFMPDTAREFMTVNHMIDERNNPYKATHGAAQLFQTNYRELGSWPLAVTAYNHGRGGMARASREMRTNQLGTIITRYKSPTFGFASKNFYAEFLAANSTYDHLLRTRKISRTKPKSNSEQIVLTRPTTIRQIAETTKLPLQRIAELNPCMNSVAISTYSNSPLPRSYVLRLPKDGAQALRRKSVAASMKTGQRSISRR